MDVRLRSVQLTSGGRHSREAAAGRPAYSRSAYIFFFSSRRRHWRLQGDWSSDVCSSDLPTDSAPFVRKKISLLFILMQTPLYPERSVRGAISFVFILMFFKQKTAYEI